MLRRLFTVIGLDKYCNVKLHDTLCSTISDNSLIALPRQQQNHYRNAIGSLSYIQAIIRPDITMTVQQCARFCNIPNKEHEEAVKRITRYLLKTKDQGLNFYPDLSKGLEYYVDAD